MLSSENKSKRTGFHHIKQEDTTSSLVEQGEMSTTTTTTTTTTTSNEDASASAAASSSTSSSLAQEQEQIKGGELVFAGSASFSMTGRGGETKSFDGVKDQNCYSFHRLFPLKGIKITKISTSCIANHMFAFSENGDCYGWGRNEDGQLGLGDTINRYNPTIISLGKKATSPIVGAACGSTHTLLYCQDGSLYSMGNGANGKLGLGGGNNLLIVDKPTLVKSVEDIVKASCGRDFSAVVSKAGKLYMFGCPENGQLGNGTDGKTLERAGKFTFDNVLTPRVCAYFDNNNILVTDVACGAQHTLAMDEEGKVYSWGFGGYGRLGHRDNKDQFLPVPIELFSQVPAPPNPSVPKFMQRVQPKIRARKIVCGASASFAIAKEPMSLLYMWGITKKTGEAQMYPTIIEDLMGCQVSSVGCGQSSTIVATTEGELITWGPSPTYGELGYGEIKRSSTKPEYVKDLAGCHIVDCTMGFGHSLVIVDTSDAASKEKVEKLKVFHPSEVSGPVKTTNDVTESSDTSASAPPTKKAKKGGGKS